MCGRFAITNQLKKYAAKYYLIEPDSIFEPNTNICPGMQPPVIVNCGKQKCLRLMNWGLKYLNKNTGKNLNIINIRVESLNSYFYKKLIDNRCLVIADGFYEWDKSKNKYFFQSNNSENLLLAGLFDAELNAFGIITMPANKTVEHVHSRMPLIINDNAADSWLSDRLTTAYLKTILSEVKYLECSAIN